MDRNERPVDRPLETGLKAVIAMAVMGIILVVAGELGHGPAAAQVAPAVVEDSAPAAATAADTPPGAISHDGLIGHAPDAQVDAF